MAAPRGRIGSVGRRRHWATEREGETTVSTRGSSPKGRTRRLLAMLMASLAGFASLGGLTAGPAGAAPAKNTTTTTASPTTTAPSPTTTAAPSGSNGVANPKLTAVVSLSLHRVLATYDR